MKVQCQTVGTVQSYAVFRRTTLNSRTRDC